MKKLTGALVLSLSFLLFSGCRSAGSTRDTGDASTPSGTESTPSPSGATGAAQDSGSTGATQPPTSGAATQTQDSGTGAIVGTGPSPGTASGRGGTSIRPSEAERQAQEACVDQWLKSRKLDRYGNAEGTMYAGGTPLFDERTGESRDRMEYVFERQPEAQKACAPEKGTGTDKSPATRPQNKK